jgi:hypothetical protein
VALEDSYRTYRDVIAAAIQLSRPDTEIACVELDARKQNVRNFNPHLVTAAYPQQQTLKMYPAG